MADRLLIGAVHDPTRHQTGYAHPERARRVDSVTRGALAGAGHAVVELHGRPATVAELGRVHDPTYLSALSSLCEAGGGEIDADTPTSARSWEAAVDSAGLGLVAVDALRAGTGTAAFVIPRPPGHHATRTRGMGFCLVNNVAVTAAAIAQTGERVAIVDWDVHHGNGTQDIFWDDPDVLYASVHEHPAYPGTGRPEETGGPHAPDGTVNVPVPAGATGDVIRAALEHAIGPVVEAFAPDWVLISAGFDAHRADPLAGLALSAGDYPDMTRTVTSWVQTGRTIAFLEGGYDLDALHLCARATAAALLGIDDRPEQPTSGGPGHDEVERAVSQRDRWKAWT